MLVTKVAGWIFVGEAIEETRKKGGVAARVVEEEEVESKKLGKWYHERMIWFEMLAILIRRNDIIYNNTSYSLEN